MTMTIEQWTAEHERLVGRLLAAHEAWLIEEAGTDVAMQTLRDAVASAQSALTAHLAAYPGRREGDAAKERLGAHVEAFAINLDWKREEGEGAFEFIQRKSYRQGWEDGKREGSGDVHRDGATPPPAPEGDARDALLRPTPTIKHDDWRGEVSAFRMDAYYYGFGPTGLEVIDLILSAVACAGKAYHHTDQWTNESSAYHDKLRGDSPAEWIENAAHDAAEAIRGALSGGGK